MATPSIPGFKPILGDIDLEETFETEIEIGVVVGIEYTDSNNTTTRRRISFSRVNLVSNTIPAFCLERGAFRQFRADRIVCFFDLDGQIYDPDEFFALLGGPNGPNIPTEEEQRPPIWETYWRRLVIFSAMSHSDGLMREDEVEEICVAMLDHAERDGVMCKEPEIEAMRARIRRIKVDDGIVFKAAKGLSTQSKPVKLRIMKSLIRIMNADKLQHASEFELMLQIQKALKLPSESGQ